MFSYISIIHIGTPFFFPNHIDEDQVINLCYSRQKKDALKNKSLKKSFKNKVQILHKII